MESSRIWCVVRISLWSSYLLVAESRGGATSAVRKRTSNGLGHDIDSNTAGISGVVLETVRAEKLWFSRGVFRGGTIFCFVDRQKRWTVFRSCANVGYGVSSCCNIA